MRNVYLPLFLLIVAFYCLFIARFGFELWDTGYIPSYSWRIANGQHVYEDFVYKAPPLTLYLHALFIELLPEHSQFYLMKICNYLMFAMQVAFAVFGFKNFYGDRIKFNIWSLACFSFVISLLNFTPYPWPTTDGVFFASIAFYFLSLKPKTFVRYGLIALFTVLSSLTKQSFYLIPLAFAIAIFLTEGKLNGFKFMALTLLMYSGFVFWIYQISSIEEFVRQTSGETHLIDFIHVGFINYLLSYQNRIVLLPSILTVSILAMLIYRRNNQINFKKYLEVLSKTLIIYSVLLCLIFEFLGASKLAFLSVVLAILLKVYEQRKVQEHVPIILALFIAWSCSISMGYNYPILFATGIIMSSIVMFDEYYLRVKNKKMFMYIGVLLMVLAASTNLYPYREAHFRELTENLDDVSPKLAGLKTTVKTKEKLLEARKLITKYGENYIMAPGFPMSHYIFNTQSLMLSDWLTNNEINRQLETYVNTASKPENFVFVEKSFIEGEKYLQDDRADFSALTVYVIKNFKKIEETEYFIIFNTNEKESRVPLLKSKPFH